MLIVCTGGRDYTDWAMVQDVLNSFITSFNAFYVGDAPGADTLVKDYCELNQIPCRVFEADWGTHGKSAGPKRNREMLDAASTEFNNGEWDKVVVLAFPGGKGTENCVKEAVKRNMIVLRVEE